MRENFDSFLSPFYAKNVTSLKLARSKSLSVINHMESNLTFYGIKLFPSESFTYVNHSHSLRSIILFKSFGKCSYLSNFIDILLCFDVCLFQALSITEKEFLEGMGVYFVSFVGKNGYDRLLSVLGRHMRDFLNGLDNLHEYLKFSYPRMKAPSFFCERETSTGLTLHYRSTRRGFLWYTIGQIKVIYRYFVVSCIQSKNVGKYQYFEEI